MSVTNDAERVVKELHDADDLTDRRIIYRDSDGHWDELVANPDGSFGGFRCLVGDGRKRITDLAEARRALFASRPVALCSEEVSEGSGRSASPRL